MNHGVSRAAGDPVRSLEEERERQVGVRGETLWPANKKREGQRQREKARGKPIKRAASSLSFKVNTLSLSQQQQTQAATTKSTQTRTAVTAATRYGALVECDGREKRELLS